MDISDKEEKKFTLNLFSVLFIPTQTEGHLPTLQVKMDLLYSFYYSNVKIKHPHRHTKNESFTYHPGIL
jgi:hypothetical protein